MIKIIVIAEVPDEMGQALCQHVRDFDISHPGCEFSMFADAPNKSVDEIAEMLNIQPPLTFKRKIKS